MNREKIKKLAEDIKNFIIKNELNNDVRIYFNDICWNFDSDGKMTVLEDIKASKMFDYANDDLLSMSFEGPLHSVLNDSFRYGNLQANFSKIFDKYDCYYELGNSWNLSTYKD